MALETGLADKVVLVTGAGSGMGRAIAARFAAEGSRVAAADVDGAGAEETARLIRESGGACQMIIADVSKRTDVEAMVGATVERFGALHVLVNNAGVEAIAPLVATDDPTWNRMMDVNARGVFLGIQLAVPEITKSGGGSIVSIASSAALRGSAAIGAYAASKSAVIMMTRCLAAELAGSGIRVNAVAPGLIDTPMGRRAIDLMGGPDAAIERIGPSLSIRRPGESSEVAAAVVFLASDLASYVTGITLPVDGGLSAL